MTDEKWAAASAIFGGSFGYPVVGFKCWAKGNLQLVFMGDYDASASYAATVPIKFRVDKEPA